MYINKFVIVLLISTLINAILFFRIIEIAYLEPREPAHAHAHNEGVPEVIKREEAPLSMLIPMVIIAAGIILIGVFSGEIIARVIKFAVPATL